VLNISCPDEAEVIGIVDFLTVSCAIAAVAPVNKNAATRAAVRIRGLLIVCLHFAFEIQIFERDADQCSEKDQICNQGPPTDSESPAAGAFNLIEGERD
jgi:hypothetical protein